MFWEHRICWVPGRHFHLSRLEDILVLWGSASACSLSYTRWGLDHVTCTKGWLLLALGSWSCELLEFGVSEAGWGLTALGEVSVPDGIIAAQAMALHYQDAAGSRSCGNSRGNSIWVFASAASPTVPIKLLGVCWLQEFKLVVYLKPPAEWIHLPPSLPRESSLSENCGRERRGSVSGQNTICSLRCPSALSSTYLKIIDFCPLCVSSTCEVFLPSFLIPQIPISLCSKSMVRFDSLALWDR